MRIDFVLIGIIIGILCLNSIESKETIRGDIKLARAYRKSPEPFKLDFTCTACVIVMTIIDYEIEDKGKEWIKKELKNECKKLKDGTLKIACDMVADFLIDEIIDELVHGITPSKICNKLSFMNCMGCSLDKLNMGNVMRIASQSNSKKERLEAKGTLLKTLLMVKAISKAKQATEPFKSTDELLPLVDIDKDKFSDMEHIYRGSDWRGRDCNDHNPGIYPTKIEKFDGTIDAGVDQNCNGIYGMNTNTKKPYETEFCQDTDSYQVLMFGDSASSGFHIPPEWFHLKNMSNILDLWTTVNDELDWPQLTYATGFKEEINGESLYMAVRERNRCSHRAYQNVGHNGHRMRDFVSQVAALHLTPKDKPFLGVMAYIGNDICKQSLKDMTTEKDFRIQMIAGLKALDAIAPPKSKLVVMGLVDARFLWNTMANRTHPLGVPYRNVYSFLTCTHANPCNTFLNNNATIRNAAAVRAEQLSKVAQQTVEEMRSQLSYEIMYLPFPLAEAVNYAKEHNIPPQDLVEPVDGFHPSVHVADRIFFKILKKELEKANWLPPVNPHNQEIIKLFGDQGGH